MILDYQAPIINGGNFTWAEYALLPRFRRYAVPSAVEYEQAVFLFEKLQPFREQLGQPLIITSGARTTDYTKHLRRSGIPAAIYSAHNNWQAVDLVCPEVAVKALWHFFDAHWLGRMELLRYTPTWVHLDTRNWGQRQRFRP